MSLSINHKITIIFVAIFLVIVLGIYLYLNINLTDHTYQRIRSNLFRELALSKSFLENYPIDTMPIERVDGIADDIGKDLDLRVTIINLAGVVLGDSELDGKRLIEVENHLYRPEIQDALNNGRGQSRRYSTTVKKDMLYVASRFGEGDTGSGVIRLSIPLVEIDAVSLRLKKMLAISFVFAFVLITIASYLASIFITKPIKEMAWIARAIAKGDFNKRAIISSHDEIADLAKAFNYMTSQIKTRIDEVIAGKSRLEAVLLSMFEGVMVTDANGTIILMNQTLKNLFIIEEDPIGKKPLEVIRNIEIQEMVENTLKIKGGVQTREISFLLQEEKTLLVHATAILRQSVLDGSVLVFHDITDLRRLEKIRQDFVANVSHELRTPVSSIKGYADTLLEGAVDDKKNAKDFLKIICSDADRLAQLINDLLDLSKIESGKMKMDIKPESLKGIVKRVVDGLKKQTKEKSITLDVDIPKGLAPVMADEGQLAQVFLNLIDNAIKYNREKGNIKISAKEEGKYVRVEIADTGIGISEKDLPRIFERFYRVDKAHSRQLGGTGLGLSIVKHIIQAHSGEVSVKSTPEQGSIFIFTIPKA